MKSLKIKIKSYNSLRNFFVWHFYYKYTKKWKEELKRVSDEVYKKRKELIGK